MYLIVYEILKLSKSRTFIFINLIPLITLFITYLSFYWHVDQGYLEQNIFHYNMESYIIDNPYFVYQTRYYGMLFLIVLPIYVAAIFSFSSHLDLKNNAFRLYANLNKRPFEIHLIKFISVFMFYITALIISYLMLIISTLSLPSLKSDVLYIGFEDYLGYTGILLSKILLLTIPMLLIHYWISLKMKSPTLNILIALVALIITFGLYNNTPYFVFIKAYSDSLTHFQLDILDLKEINWKALLFSLNYNFSDGIFSIIILSLIISDFYFNWWNKSFKSRKYIQ